MISHRNVIANTMQIKAYENPWRKSMKSITDQSDYTDVALGLLPQNHIYSLVVICHATTYRGDQVIILPKFEIAWYLESIARFKINSLYLVSICNVEVWGDEFE
jgi:acyl-CoA synthetase (AMP-forming)/AMP-acid ligase II